MLDLETILNDIKEIIIDIGEYQAANFTKRLEISLKTTEHDLVTNIDKSSEKRIVSFLKEKYPSHAVIAEEGGDVVKASDFRWIIDPLDGTNNFAHGFPIFTISIALECKDEIVLGCVYCPLLKELFYAVKGKGAYLNGEEISVSMNQNLNHAILATGFPYDKGESPDNNLDHLNRLLPQVRGLRRTGSAAYDLCNVARGSFDGYWEVKLNLWDIAAGKLIVEEAGGKIISISDHDKIRLIAGNDYIVNNLLQELKKVNDYWDISL